MEHIKDCNKKIKKCFLSGRINFGKLKFSSLRISVSKRGGGAKIGVLSFRQ
jgi:hypothetical protein